MALARLVAAVIDKLTLTNWGAPPNYESGCLTASGRANVRMKLASGRTADISQQRDPYRFVAENVSNSIGPVLSKRLVRPS
jgi:hypothetical protein